MGITKEFFHFSTKYKNTIVSLFLKTVVFWLPPPCAPLPPPPPPKCHKALLTFSFCSHCYWSSSCNKVASLVAVASVWPLS